MMFEDMTGNLKELMPDLRGRLAANAPLSDITWFRIGGPACLRLRVPLQESEVDAVARHRRWSPQLDEQLREAIEETYPTSVTINDLSEADFVEQASRASEQVTRILQRDH